MCCDLAIFSISHLTLYSYVSLSSRDSTHFHLSLFSVMFSFRSSSVHKYYCYWYIIAFTILM